MRKSLLFAVVGLMAIAFASACFTVTTKPTSFYRGEASEFEVSLSNNCTQPAMVWLYSSDLGVDSRYIVSAGQEVNVSIPVSGSVSGVKTYPLDVYVNGDKRRYYLRANIESKTTGAEYTVVTLLCPCQARQIL